MNNIEGLFTLMVKINGRLSSHSQLSLGAYDRSLINTGELESKDYRSYSLTLTSSATGTTKTILLYRGDDFDFLVKYMETLYRFVEISTRQNEIDEIIRDFNEGTAEHGIPITAFE